MSGTNRFAGTTGHPVSETKTGLAVAMDKGHVVTKIEQKQRPSYRKGKLNKRVAFVREVVKEVVGFSPYEKRCMELIKVRAGSVGALSLPCLASLRAPPRLPGGAATAAARTRTDPPLSLVRCRVRRSARRSAA